MSIAVGRRVRRLGGRLIRRLRLLPEGEPDGLGDDEALLGGTLPFSVMVYFPDTMTNLYQLQQWYGPLRRLDGEHRVGVVCLDSRTAAAVRAQTPFPVICAARSATLDDLVSRSTVSLALYVNHNVRNLQCLRFASMFHAYLGHGESDKVASTSNQVKAYDFVLVAGAAGRERLRRTLLHYDVDAHVRLVGRPPLDQPATAGPTAADRRPTVLYAPTWEGAQPSMAYSSVRSHGHQLLTSLLADGGLRVVYRPHPRTGANRPDFAIADAELRELISTSARTDPGAEHRVDTAPSWNPLAEPADVLVSDISAVASDWLVTGKPLVVTRPLSPAAYIDSDTLLDHLPSLPASAAGRAAEVVHAALADQVASQRRALTDYTLGDVTPGASTQRFLSVCSDLIRQRDLEVSARAARNLGGGS
ncbi:MAG: CDP-glycerol glycerophosphotransferase family protein [bacterium]